MAEIWQAVLKRETIGVHDHFFDLGGHSLLAAQVVARVQNLLGTSAPAVLLFHCPCLADFAAALAALPASAPRTPLVCLKPGTRTPTFFCIHPITGQVLAYLALASLLDPEEPFFALEHPGLQSLEGFPTSIEQLASLYLGEIRALQPEGPYLLGGWSLGGLLAFETARQLRAAELHVALLALFDAASPADDQLEPYLATQPLPELAAFLRTYRVPEPGLAECLGLVGGTDPCPALPALHDLLQRRGWLLQGVPLEQFIRLHGIYSGLAAAARCYRPARDYDSPITYFRRSENLGPRSLASTGWEGLTSGPLTLHVVPGDHLSMFRPPHLSSLAARLQVCLSEARQGLH